MATFSSSTPPRKGFDVPWCVRDVLKVMGFSYLTSFGLAITMAFVLGLCVRFARVGSPDPQWLMSLFTAPSWRDSWYLIHGLLTLLFLSVLLLRPHAVSLRSFFARGVAVSGDPEQVVTTSGFATEMRQASRFFVLALLLTLVVIGLSVVALSLVAHPVLHQDPGALVATYLDGRVRESRRLLASDMSGLRMAIVVFLAPPLEELVFRGCLYAALRNRLVAWQANLLSSLLFAALHLYVFNFPNVLLIGMLAAHAYERTRSLRTPVVFHMVWNLFGVASVRPWLWLVFAILASGGLMLWLRRPRHPSAQDRRTGWKVYAALLPVMFACTYAMDRSTAWQWVCDIPLFVAVVLYAWKRSGGPTLFWMLYGLAYPVWDGVVIWASMIPEGIRAPWQQALAGSEPIETMSDLLIEVAGDLVLLGPAILVVWRLATRTATRLPIASGQPAQDLVNQSTGK